MGRVIAGLARVVGALALAAGVSCASPERQEWENTFAGDGEDLFLVDDDLGCIGEAPWEPVGNYKLWNPLGHQLEAAEHGRTNALGAFPVGTVISLFHGEVSVKRGRGFSPETADWEFLTLGVDADRQTVILDRGTTAIRNVGGSCVDCHDGAAAFDYVCGDSNNCGALPFFVDTSPDSLVEDPRCGG